MSDHVHVGGPFRHTHGATRHAHQRGWEPHDHPGDATTMGCTDPPRHEFRCAHPRRTVRWATDDGCSGEVCVTDAVLVVGRWPDVTSAVEVYANTGMPVDPAHRREGERQVGALVDTIAARFPPPVTHDYKHDPTSGHDHDDRDGAGIARHTDGSHTHPQLLPDEVTRLFRLRQGAGG